MTQPPYIKIQTGVTIPQFIGYLFFIRDRAHLLHLNTKSFSAHKALNEFYDELLELIDDLTESTQEEGILEITIPESDGKGTPVKMLDDCLLYVRQYRHVFPHSWQQNELDNVEKLISKTIYKLENLK